MAAIESRPCRAKSSESCGARAAVALALMLSVALAAALASPASAAERLFQRFDERDGLRVAETCDLAQDADGFIWVGTIGGLFRFDGGEMRAWEPDRIRHVIQVLSTGPHGEVIAAGDGEPLWNITREGAEPIAGPNGRPIDDWIHACLGRDGALWVVKPDTLFSRDPEGRWTSWPRESFDPAALYRVQPTLGDSVYVGTRGALYIVARGRQPRRVADIPFLWQVDHQRDGTPVLITARGGLWRLAPSGPEQLAQSKFRAIGLAVRGDAIWAVLDGNVTCFAPGQPPEVVAPSGELNTGRPLLVDREGTLWIGGYRGLMALPEPATVTWNSHDGLPQPTHAHKLERSGNSIWLITWNGTARIDLGPPRRVVPLEKNSGRIRADARGRVWAADFDKGFVRFEGSKETHFARAKLHGLYGTSIRPDSTMWLSTDDGLFIAPLDDGAPKPVAGAPPAAWNQGWTESWLDAVLEDSRGRLWLWRGDEIWWCNADSLVRGLPVRWDHAIFPDSQQGTELLEVDDGEIWTSTANTGVFRFHDARWEPLPGNRTLGSLRVYGMVHSPSGGVWLLCAGTLARVMPRLDLPDGWEVLERLSSWQGLPTQQAADLHEDPDGHLWLATLAGLVEVPPEARHAVISPPPVQLVDVRVDGQRLPPDQEIRLPWRRNRLELHFAALTFRDRERLRFQARLRPDAAWQESEEPVFRFVDLSPGAYTASVRASLDGEHWSEMPRTIRFSVARPWWQEAWAIALFAALIAAALYAAHRLRVAVLLRLERQRVRIAMDLHDEVGSGLGSIGILAGLASDERVEEAERRELASRISETASELGASLGDIVRSLREANDTSDSFAARLAAGARRLVPDGRLALALPERWPEQRMSPEVQRELRAVALEAVHNAVRHAGARRIELGMLAREDQWLLWVEDDGAGIDDTQVKGSGYGLLNLRERCRSIGARVVWTVPQGGGTRMEVLFRPDSRRVSRMSMRRRAPRDSGMLKP